MSMLDSFFSRGFKAAKCKTLLKLTIPRIKLLRNRREAQMKQMRREIAKLLENGQEATARIRVEHIVREEKMMAAQEILELFCELISVRLPVIEAQRDCPLDLKEAISSVCFAAPRCSDLVELQHVQMLFVSKYGKEFVSAATELRPDCGVNRKLVELLSVSAPSPETKLKLLKDIAEEHELDWNPADTESAFFKSHEDLLDGPNQFSGGSKLPLPKEEDKEGSHSSAHVSAPMERSDSDSDFETLDFPEVPNVVPRPRPDAAPQSVLEPVHRAGPSPDLSSESEIMPDAKSTVTVKQSEFPVLPSVSPPVHTLEPVHRAEPSPDLPFKSETMPEAKSTVTAKQSEIPISPFVSPPVHTPESESVKVSDYSPPFPSSETFFQDQSRSPPEESPRTRPDTDLMDVVAAARTAAENAERAAAAARSAASVAHLRIAELTKKNTDRTPTSPSENPFCSDESKKSPSNENPQQRFDHQDSNVSNCGDNEQSSHQPQRLPSMEDDAYFSYPNLFASQNPASLSSSSENSKPPHHY